MDRRGFPELDELRKRSEEREVSSEKAPTFQDPMVWQKAHQLVLDLYKATESFPSREMYGLTAQFRRAAISIPANIAEGFRKPTAADKRRYYFIALGSCDECAYSLILARDLGYLNNPNLDIQLQEVSRMLNAYANKVGRS